MFLQMPPHQLDPLCFSYNSALEDLCFRVLPKWHLRDKPEMGVRPQWGGAYRQVFEKQRVSFCRLTSVTASPGTGS